jgi:alpha-N-arabinofuranosidase
MDGPWQICQKTASEYGRAATEAAKVMKWVDPSLQLAACGSSHRAMPTFGAWEYEVMEHTFDHVDFLSLHMYFANPLNDSSEFFANIDIMDRFIKEAAAVSDAVAAKRRSGKRMMLSFDEWNVWYKARSEADHQQPGWPIAPRLIEEVYDLMDALMVGGALITLLNNADRVKCACLAQLVNVIGAIKTEPGGPAWRQTIFHPFKLVAELAHGSVLQTRIEGPKVTTKTAGEAPELVVSAVFRPESQAVTLFLLNRSPDSEVEVDGVLRGFPAFQKANGQRITGNNLQRTNTAADPDAVVPQSHQDFSLRDDSFTLRIPPLSWDVLTLNYKTP